MWGTSTIKYAWADLGGKNLIEILEKMNCWKKKLSGYIKSRYLIAENTISKLVDRAEETAYNLALSKKEMKNMKERLIDMYCRLR